MRSFPPLYAAALEALRQRAVIATGKGISKATTLFAFGGTVALASVCLKIIFSLLDSERREALPGSGAWQSEVGLLLCGLCFAVTAWDIFRLMLRKDGVVKCEAMTEDEAEGGGAETLWNRLVGLLSKLKIAATVLFATPFTIAADRLGMVIEGKDSVLGVAIPRSMDIWVFPPKHDALMNSPVKRALATSASVLIRIPLWAIMTVSIILLIGTSIGLVPLAAAAFIFLAAAATPLMLMYVLYIVARYLARRLWIWAATCRAVLAKPLFKERLAASLERLASEAPHALAAAEEKALAKASASKPTKKKTLRI